MNSVSTQRMLERKVRHVNADFTEASDTLEGHARNAKFWQFGPSVGVCQYVAWRLAKSIELPF